MTERSNRWDERERSKMNQGKPPSKRTVLVVGLLVLGVMALYALYLPSAYPDSEPKSETMKNLKSMLDTDDFRKFKADYKTQIQDCFWAHSTTNCHQEVITHYQNQLILEKLGGEYRRTSFETDCIRLFEINENELDTELIEGVHILKKECANVLMS